MFYSNILRSTLAALFVSAPITVHAQATDIVATAEAAGEFTVLVEAVRVAGMEDVLSSGGPFTLFAPNDAAFEALPEGALESLMDPANRDQLVALLSYHLVPGQMESFDLQGRSIALATVNGTPLAVDGMAGVRIDDAQVIEADILATNGVIHVIDRVLIPAG